MFGVLLLLLVFPLVLGLKQSHDLFINEGLNVTLSCSQIGTSHNSMYWFRKRPAESLKHIVYFYVKTASWEKDFEQRASAVRNGASLDLTLSKLQSSDNAMYYCAKQDNSNSPAYFGNGTKLTVLDPDIPVSSPEVRIIKPSDKELCKKAVTLVCVAENFYPDHVTIKWKIGEDVVTKGLATDPYATPNKVTKKFDMSSRLKIRPNVWNDAKKKFTCIVTFYNGKNYTHESAEIYGIAGNGFNKEDHMTQAGTVKLAYGVFIAKSGLYGIFIFFFVRRQVSAGK